MRNNKGFSLLELMIGLGLLTLIVGGAAFVLKDFNFGLKSLETDIGNDIESSIAERIIMRDLKHSEPSFNNMLIKDDNGRGFFDFVIDPVDKGQLANSGRTLTMSETQNSFTFLSANEVVGGAIIYDPAMAYDIGPEPKEFDKAATLNFKSLNKNKYLQLQNPAYWSEGRMLMLDTPASIRSLINGVPNYNNPSRSPVFVGVVSLINPMLTPVTLNSLIDTNHPAYPSKKMTSEDVFLRSVPAIGGGAALVRLKAVNAVRYTLEKNSAQQINMVRYLWAGGSWSSPQVISTKVIKATLTRKAINDPLIYFKIYRIGDN